MRLLDLFSCEGIGGDGYARAGWRVYAVDLDPRRLRHDTTATGRLVADALDVLARLVAGEAVEFTLADGSTEYLRLEDFAAIHASPPCQRFTRGNAGRRRKARRRWPDLIGPVREGLVATGLPYVIENVEDAGPLLVDPALLCGSMFGLTALDADGQLLRLERHRLFETSWPYVAPAHVCAGPGWVAGVYGGGRRAKRRPGETLAEVAPRDRHEARYVRRGGYVPRSRAAQAALLGVDRPTTLRGLQECLPPAYTEHLGRALAAHVLQEVAA